MSPPTDCRHGAAMAQFLFRGEATAGSGPAHLRLRQLIRRVPRSATARRRLGVTDPIGPPRSGGRSRTSPGQPKRPVVLHPVAHGRGDAVRGRGCAGRRDLTKWRSAFTKATGSPPLTRDSAISLDVADSIRSDQCLDGSSKTRDNNLPTVNNCVVVRCRVTPLWKGSSWSGYRAFS
jgi:hypothetical protein